MDSLHSPVLTDLLRSVSRSFYLTLRVLPSMIRPQIGVAYLLARATDTIADTDALPLEQRLQTLDLLREKIASDAKTSGLAFTECQGSSAGERVLLSRIDEVLALLQSFSSDDRRRIRNVLLTIISGQQLDLQRFASASTSHIVPLETDEELDDYTYRVAGCVGDFWTRMCLAHVFSRTEMEPAAFLAHGVRFGKGLQLVNILRDIPADLRKGRCYLPSTGLAKTVLNPRDLLDPLSEQRFRPLYDRYLDLAQGHLAAGWAYTNAIPRRYPRLRLACAWPLLIGARTLAKLRVENVLDPAHRVKVSRAEVRRILTRSILAVAWPRAWATLFE